MRQTILLADDSPTIQRLVIQTFADTPYDIVSVSNGDAAIRKVEEIQPAVVLADIYMPGKNGFEVCSYIHAHHLSTPVILLIGAFDAFDESAADLAGAAAHITKPFEARVLIDLVISVLAKAAADAAAREQQQPEPGEAGDSAVSPAAGEFDASDILGLEELFRPQALAASTAVPPSGAHLGDEDLDRIADRVVQKLSTQIIENVAWDVVPDIAIKVVRDELRRASHGTTHEG